MTHLQTICEFKKSWQKSQHNFRLYLFQGTKWLPFWLFISFVRTVLHIHVIGIMPMGQAGSSPAPQLKPVAVATTYVLQQPDGAAGMLQSPYPSNSGLPTSYQY
jgi:hypothetical protein